MEIGGIDIVFQAPSPADTTLQERTLKFLQDRWPIGVVESDQTSEPVPLRDSASWESLKDSSELFFYPSPEAEASWTEHGARDENINQMIQVLVSPPDQTTNEREVTVVIGESTAEMKRIVNELRDALQVGARTTSRP
jgi:hypothetical protein